MNSAEFKLENPIIVALDVDSADECLRLSQVLSGKVGAFKIGPRLNVRYGADLISKLSESAPVFVDNKYLDIPSTMEGAIRATFAAGATLTTVHAWAGPEALKLLAKVERELNQIRPFKILVVTILTSFEQNTLPPGLAANPIKDHVLALADLAIRCGLTGIVCSPHEVESIRALHPQAFLVTPGVRMPDNSAGDQKRIETPEAAMKKGSSALVVGRPIYEAKDPAMAADIVFASAQKGRV